MSQTIVSSIVDDLMEISVTEDPMENLLRAKAIAAVIRAHIAKLKTNAAKSDIIKYIVYDLMEVFISDNSEETIHHEKAVAAVISTYIDKILCNKNQ